MTATNNLAEAQLELELINEARLNPMANAARYITSYAPLTSSNQEVQNNFNFWNVNGTVLQSQFSQLQPVDPLAWNDTLAATALAHDNVEIDANRVDHVIGSEKSIGDRISLAGYHGTNATYMGENIEGQFHDPMAAHASFMVDWGNPGLGHRDNIMGINTAANPYASNYREIGIAAVDTAVQSNIGPFVVTEDFGGRGSSGVFITGVAYNDTDHNRFYSVGEGLGNLGASLGGASVNSSSAGGYTLATSLTGLQTLTYTGAGLAAPVQVTANLVDGHNYKIDVIDGHTLQTSVSATISGPISEVHGLGVTGLALTTGAGSQTFYGTIGSDTFNGGADADTVVYAGRMADYKITNNADGSVTVAGAEGTDRLISIENIRFFDQTYPTTPSPGSVAINDVMITEGDAGTQMATFTVTRTGGSAAFDVNFATADGSATVADGDYAKGAGTLHFAAGVNTQTVSVAINGDTRVEGNETLNVLLSGATNGATISDASGTATIVNNDAAPVAGAIAINDVMITEGDAGTQMATFTVTRTGGSAAFDVNFATADGSATLADGDYAKAAGTLHFAAGVNTQTVSVAINGDTRVEGNETLNVLLSGATNGATISDASGTATIVNNDAAPVAGAIAINDVMITEGDAGTQMATFTVTRTGGSAAFDVNFATADGTATAADGDYAKAAGTLHFAAGVNTQTVSVAINGDTRVEGNESLNVLLSGATNGATISDASGTATIVNDDAAPVAGAIAINDVMITEGNAGSQMATFTVTRTGGSAAFDVNFATADGTATAADGDYAKNAGTLHFAAGVNTQTVSVAINGDTKFESNESLNVLLSGATNGATISDASGTATIVNDDTAAANNAPVVTTHDVSVAANGSIAASSMFVAHDQEGDKTITEYAFWDGGSAGGHFSVNGVTQASGQWTVVNASDLGTVSYVGGAAGDAEKLFVAAYDGQAWSPATTSLTATTTLPDTHAPADFNGDGHSDILWRNDSGSVAMWQMNGTQIVANQVVSPSGTAWHIEGKGDFNGDGHADVLWRSDTGSVAMWEMDGTKIIANQVVSGAGTDWHVAGIGDFNGDGHSDVLWRNDNGTVAMWEMDGTKIIANQVVSGAGTAWHVAGVGDFNGDGHSDVAWQNDNGTVAMWEMDGTKIIANQVVGSVAKDQHVAGIGDFDGDGHSDILLRSDSGAVSMLQMNGTQIVANQAVGSAGNDWHIVDTGDYNGDHHTDILWRSDTGAVAMWEMDGPHIIVNQGVGAASSDWHTA